MTSLVPNSNTVLTTASSVRQSTIPCEVRNLGIMDYEQAWQLQKELVNARAAETLDHDVILITHHPSVFTAGKRTEAHEFPAPGCPIPVIKVDRGGRITWHGPGQIVIYPIIKLIVPLDVVRFVRRLESAMIATCDHFNVSVNRIAGRSGVWVLPEDSTPARKLGAIGVRISQGVTQHGLALNCNNSLDAYNYIVACGLADAAVSTLSNEAEHTITAEEVTPILVESVINALDGKLIIENPS